MSNKIEFRNVSKMYGKEKLAVNDISFEVNSGELLGFLGPNGSGKSTSLKMLIGILEPTNGEIYINGIKQENENINIKKIVRFVSDNPDIYEKTTGLDYLNFIADIYEVNSSERKERIEKYANLFEIYDDLNNYICDYSHGMKQKLVLISTFITEPEIMVLDEPMVGLDVKTSYNLKKILREFADNGKIVIFSSHILEVVEKICDKVIILNKGNVKYFGSLTDLRNFDEQNRDLETIFLELTNNE